MASKHFLLPVLLAFSAYLFSQDDSTDEKKFWLGPKFGLDVSSSSADLSSITNQLKQNYQVGMFLQLGKKIYFQPEIYYSSYTTDATANTKINFVKAPMMLGWQIFDIGLVSLHLNGGPSYLKQLDSDEKAVINWAVGAGVNILGFITTDLRYTFQKGSTNGITQVEQLITNGGMVNFTVGLRL
jgi:hypothetical protein